MESRNKKRMMTAAGRFAYSRFALNYAVYYESMGDFFGICRRNDPKISPAEQEMLEAIKETKQELIELVRGFLNGRIDIKKVEDFRNRILSEAEKVVAFIDCFALYDYVLKRLDRRFLDEVPAMEADGDVVNAMMGFVVSARDNMERNQRIKALLAELPMRFTRAKFFSMIRQAMTVYEGTDRQAFEQAVAALRRESLLSLPQGMEDGHEKLMGLLRELENADYRNLDKDKLSGLWKVFHEAQDILFDLSTERMNLMEIVNDFYVMCLAGQDMLMDSKEKEDIYALVAAVTGRLEQKDYALPSDVLESLLIPLEGRQEACYEQWSRFENTDAEVLLGKEACAQDKEIIWKVNRLLSTSIYAPLTPEEEPAEDGILLSRKAVEVMCQPFCDELEADWKMRSKCIVRAMMANLLSKLPMFFLTSDELREFLLGCLSSCTDMAEKSASIEEILRVVEMEDDLE